MDEANVSTNEVQPQNGKHDRPYGRQSSLSQAENVFLHNLLIDETAIDVVEPGNDASRVLNDEMLFSVPPNLHNFETKPPKLRRRSILGLWKAHEAGVHPHQLVAKATRSLNEPLVPEKKPLDKKTQRQTSEPPSEADDVQSDEEVRHEKDEQSTNSSWSDDEHFEHFDSWEVLKNDYTADLGYDFNHPVLVDGDDAPSNTFLILGTSASDKSSQPHVLSPPLMVAISGFLPQQLEGENFWMKFSLLRDGASLNTMKHYARASSYSILAIETDKGEVFGAFTSESWRNHFGYYGSAPAFVWTMKHSRLTKYYSLFDQAQMESEIEVFLFAGKNKFVQVCRHDLLAVGGDNDAENPSTDAAGLGFVQEHQSYHAKAEDLKHDGFAIALEDDLLKGTTSPCSSFKSPALCGDGDKSEVFYVANLEVWGFTPCRDEDTAEKMEMTKFFVEQSSRNSMFESATSSIGSPASSRFGSAELVQEDFYRRVGHDSESEMRREQWQYRNIVDDNAGSVRVFGATPRFGPR